MSAHSWGYITCYEPTSHIEVEHTVGSTAGKNRTPFSGPAAVSFFPFEIEPVLGFWKISSFVCTFFNDFWKHCFFPFCFFENEFVFLIFAPHFLRTRMHISHYMHLVRQILIHVKFWSSGSKIALIPPLAKNYSKKLMGPLESLARLWINFSVSTEMRFCYSQRIWERLRDTEFTRWFRPNW